MPRIYQPAPLRIEVDSDPAEWHFFPDGDAIGSGGVPGQSWEWEDDTQASTEAGTDFEFEGS